MSISKNTNHKNRETEKSTKDVNKKSAKFYHAYVTRIVQFQIHNLQHIAKEPLFGLPNDLMKKGKHFILI